MNKLLSKISLTNIDKTHEKKIIKQKFHWIHMQKEFWSTNSQNIRYKRKKKKTDERKKKFLVLEECNHSLILSVLTVKVRSLWRKKFLVIFFFFLNTQCGIKWLSTSLQDCYIFLKSQLDVLFYAKQKRLSRLVYFNLWYCRLA